MRMPATAPTEMHARVGDVAVLDRDLYIHNYLDYTLGRNREASDRDDANLFGNDSYVEATLTKGTEIDVVGLTSRRLPPPPGIFYYYVCRVRASKQKFDLPQDLESAVHFKDRAVAE
jgi:hypothetical protein